MHWVGYQARFDEMIEQGAGRLRRFAPKPDPAVGDADAVPEMRMALAPSGRWRAARVVNRHDDAGGLGEVLKLHYVGYSAGFDEWVPAREVGRFKEGRFLNRKPTPAEASAMRETQRLFLNDVSGTDQRWPVERSPNDPEH